MKDNERTSLLVLLILLLQSLQHRPRITMDWKVRASTSESDLCAQDSRLRSRPGIPKETLFDLSKEALEFGWRFCGLSLSTIAGIVERMKYHLEIEVDGLVEWFRWLGTSWTDLGDFERVVYIHLLVTLARGYVGNSADHGFVASKELGRRSRLTLHELRFESVYSLCYIARSGEIMRMEK